MVKKIAFIVGVSVVAMAAPASAAVNLISNGSFESGTTGWSVNNNEGPGAGQSAPVVIAYNQASNYPTGAFGESVPTDNALGNPSPDAAGLHGFYFSSDQAIAPQYSQSLSQSVSLVANHSYIFGFDAYKPQNGQNNPNDASFDVSIAGTPFFSVTPGTLPAQTWEHCSGSQAITANMSGDFLFKFSSLGYTAKDYVIDRVYLIDTTSNVPEPATWGMMLMGFGLVGGAMRRRSTTRLALA